MQARTSVVYLHRSVLKGFVSTTKIDASVCRTVSLAMHAVVVVLTTWEEVAASSVKYRADLMCAAHFHQQAAWPRRLMSNTRTDLARLLAAERAN